MPAAHAASPHAAALTPGLRVLVADDNPVSREMALRMLAQLGCQADSAADGYEALAAHRAAPYHLILMDCDMPGLDGYAAAMQLRQEEQGVRTPVLALTAHSGPEQAERCRRAGMDALLTKPLRPQMLREALGQWFDAITASTPGEHNDELEAVREMFGADFTDLAALYRQDGPVRIATLRHAHAGGDTALLAKVAHALGGSSASIGASGLAMLCRELELRTKAGLLDDAAARLALIEAEYRRVSDKLQSLLAS